MEPDKQPLSGDSILGLVAMSLAVLAIANDFTAFSVALPAIEAKFNSDVTTVQWIINGYALVFGVLIITGGRLADRFGRRLVFFIGAAIFAGFSLLGGIATDMWMLLVARGLMGIGGALMWPAMLGMTYGLLPGNRAALAGALIIGVAGFGNAIGPMLGGTLTELLSWRWIFLVNLPVCALAVLVTWRVVRRDRPEATSERVDYAGIIALSIGLMSLLLSLDLGIDVGWSNPEILGLWALFAAGLVSFAFIERSSGSNALVPGEVIRNRVFVAACVATLLMSAIFFAAMLYLPQFMIKELGYSAIRSGAGLLPMMCTFALTSFASGTLYERLGAKAVVSLGAASLAAGMYLLSGVHAPTSFTELVPGMVVLGIGIGLFYSSITTAAITAVDPSRASLGGAIVYMFQVAGGSIGLGFNTALVVTAPSLTAGIHRAFLVDSCLALCGLVVSVLFIGGRISREQLHSLVHRHRAHG